MRGSLARFLFPRVTWRLLARLLVVVEPRDRTGRTVDAPANMSVVVIDPALEGNAARVARWDFTVAETAAELQVNLWTAYNQVRDGRWPPPTKPARWRGCRRRRNTWPRRKSLLYKY